MPLRGFGLADDSRGLAAVVLPSTILTTGEGPYADADRRAEGTIAAGIRDAFGETPPAIETGAEYARYLPLRDLIDFSRPKFDVAISLSPHRSVALPPGMVHLEKVCGYVTERVPFEEIVAADYITTDNMLQKRGGVVPYAGNPVPGSVVRYRKGDILISNIRPYLKKIWFADRDGGCSPDVLVLRSKDAKKALPEYLFECVSADAFFDYVMEGKSGVKMPRGDKDQILRYPIKDVALSVQQKVVAECAKIDAACAKLRKQAEADRGEIEAIMGKVFKPFGDAQSGVGFASLHPLVALSDCAEIVRGVTYAKEDQVAERTDCVVLTADNITLGGELSVQKEVFLRKSFQADEQKALKKGDCFICLSSGSRQHVGKVAFVEQDLHCYAGGFMGILRASKGNCLPRYLYEVLNSAVGREVVRQKSGGANIKNLSNSIGEIKIPVPPLGEQEVVVGKVEKLEAAIASAERQLSAASSSKAAILARILG